MIEIKTKTVSLDYITPVPVNGRLVSSNDFLQVTVLGKDYFLSTLPGFHQASLTEIDFNLKHFFKDYPLDFIDIDFSKRFFNLIKKEDSFLQSIQTEMLFHIESILLGMIQSTHPQMFSHDEILVNQLYREQNDLSFYKNSGCVKIKIVPNNALFIAELIKELHRENPLQLFRLDGNRRFEIEEMIDFEIILKETLPRSAFIRIDYVEEPFKNYYDSFLYEKRSELKTAIDESFINFMNAGILLFPSVIKPSLIGLSPVISWLRSHQDNRAIISTSFEHPTILVGLEFLARFRPYEYHGLEKFIK